MPRSRQIAGAPRAQCPTIAIAQSRRRSTSKAATAHYPKRWALAVACGQHQPRDRPETPNWPTRRAARAEAIAHFRNHEDRAS
jgi:hypothetical protein